MAQFLPTFGDVDEEADLEINDDGDELDETPLATDVQELSPPNESIYYFIVDRSGSMSGTSMNLTKQALVLFLQSLPIGCYFHIVSFGTDFEFMYK